MIPKNTATPRRHAAKVIDKDGNAITSGVAAYHITPNGLRILTANPARHIANGQWDVLPTHMEVNHDEYRIEFYHADAIGGGPIVQVATGPEVSQGALRVTQEAVPYDLIGAWGGIREPHYNGVGVRVRRVSDDAILDVGFDGDVLDEAALTAFLTATTGAVVNRYDQVGAVGFRQSVAARQPVVNGIIETYTGSQFLHLGQERVGNVGLFCGPDEQWTARVWFKIATLTGTILGRASGTAGNRTFQIYTLSSASSLRLNVILRGEQSGILATHFDPDDGEWHCVTVRWDGSTAWWYVDGSPRRFMNVGAAAEDTGEVISLGARTVGDGSSAGSVHFQGDLGPAEIFSAPITDSEEALRYLAQRDALRTAPDLSGVDFDGGLVNLGESALDASAPVTIRPVRLLSELWTNYGCILSNADGETPAISLLTANKRGTDTDAIHWGWWTYDPDSDDWYPFDNVLWADGTVTVSNNAAFNQSLVYVSFLPGYTDARNAAKIATWVASPYVSATLSAPAFIAGSTGVRLNINERWIPRQPVHAFRITDAAVTDDKNIAMLTGGVHPGESMARWTFEGAIDWLLGSSAEAAALRRSFIFYCCPDCNPSARYAGYGREAAELPYADFNRQWLQPDALAPDSMRIIRAANVLDTGGVCHASIDFHGRYLHTAVSCIWSQHSVGENVAFFNAVNARHSDEMSHDNWSEATDRAGWVQSQFGASLVVNAIAEEACDNGKSIADYRAFGEHLMGGLYDLLVADAFPYPVRAL